MPDILPLERNPLELSRRKFDVVVVGGGIHGACAAREAAMRGYSVALIERRDFGSETSHNSLKLIHGGMRYIQHLDFRRMRESVVERRIWLSIAPHLVRPLRIVNPTTGFGTRSRAAFRTAMKIHELVGYDRNSTVHPERRVPCARIISKAELKKTLPTLAVGHANGAALWYDGQMLNANRLVLECIQSAVSLDAIAANYTEAVKVLVSNDRAIGVEVRDRLSGDLYTIRASAVVNTCGPWIESLLSKNTKRHGGNRRIPLTKSMNIVVSKLTEDFAFAVTSQRRSDSVVDRSKRMYFATPWRGVSVVGTAHEHFDRDPDDCNVSASELEGFLDEFNAAYPPAALTLDDIHYVHWGLTPGTHGSGSRSDKRERKSMILSNRSIEGLFSVVGVKYTTGRLLGEQVVNALSDYLEQPTRSSETRTSELPGAIDWDGEERLKRSIESSDVCKNWSSNAIEDLAINYGTRWRQVASCRWSSDMPSDLSPMDLMVLHAVREEMAVKLEDVVLRRIDAAERGILSDADLERCADIMSIELNWPNQQKDQEVESTRHRLRAAYQSSQ